MQKLRRVDFNTYMVYNARKSFFGVIEWQSVNLLLRNKKKQGH